MNNEISIRKVPELSIWDQRFRLGLLESPDHWYRLYMSRSKGELQSISVIQADGSRIVIDWETSLTAFMCTLKYSASVSKLSRFVVGFVVLFKQRPI